jgi:hypothetical protein
MKYYLFKTPRKPGDKAIEESSYEYGDFMLGQKALKFGPIVMLSEHDLEVEKIEQNI